MMGWSMKNDRDLMQLAVANLSVDEIANRMKSGPERILKVAKRLGIRLPPIAPKRSARLQTKRQ
jgi:hypothetical protein